jgi:hypothetical protein
MTLKTLRELTKDFPEDAEILVDTEARRFNAHLVNIESIYLLDEEAYPTEDGKRIVQVLLDYTWSDL